MLVHVKSRKRREDETTLHTLVQTQGVEGAAYLAYGRQARVAMVRHWLLIMYCLIPILCSTVGVEILLEMLSSVGGR